MNNEELQNPRPYRVFAIEQGTVIDHINAGQALKIIRILNLAEHNRVISIGLNFTSKSLKFKDIIKVENRELSTEEMNRVAIFAPHATINIIRDYKIHNKSKVEIPKIIDYVIVCPNPKCITNNDETFSKFNVISKNGQLKLKCHYCEKVFEEQNIREYKNN